MEPGHLISGGLCEDEGSRGRYFILRNQSVIRGDRHAPFAQRNRSNEQFNRLSGVSDVDYAASLASGSLSLLRLQVLGMCSIWAVDHEDPVVQYFVRGAV